MRITSLGICFSHRETIIRNSDLFRLTNEVADRKIQCNLRVITNDLLSRSQSYDLRNIHPEREYFYEFEPSKI
jgi:hypothetical protein